MSRDEAPVAFKLIQPLLVCSLQIASHARVRHSATGEGQRAPTCIAGARDCVQFTEPNYTFGSARSLLKRGRSGGVQRRHRGGTSRGQTGPSPGLLSEARRSDLQDGHSNYAPVPRCHRRIFDHTINSGSCLRHQRSRRGVLDCHRSRRAVSRPRGQYVLGCFAVGELASWPASDLEGIVAQSAWFPASLRSNPLPFLTMTLSAEAPRLRRVPLCRWIREH